LENDLKSIGVEHESVEDISEYFSEELPPVHPGAKKRFVKYSLKDVAASLFPGRTFQCNVHSAVTDARMTMNCWKRKREFSNAKPEATVYYGTISRSKKSAFVFDKNDKCMCPGSGKKSKFYPS
jgi:hypothetical protein